MRLLLSLLLFLILAQLPAQDFHRYYDLGGAESIRDLIVLSPDRLVAAGNSREADDTDQAVLLTLNGAGEVLRSVTLDYDLRTRGMALARQTDSTFWMGCWRTPVGIVDDWVVYRINANTGEATGFGWGAVNTDEQIRAMAAYPDGGVVVVGNTGDTNEAIISRLDAVGNELFRKSFSIPDNRFTILTDVKAAPNGNIFAAGGFLSTGGPSGKNGYFIAEFSPAGGLLRSRRYDFPAGEDGSDGAGVALELLEQGFMAMVGTRRLGEGRQSVAIIVDGNLDVAGAFQNGELYTAARDVLAPGRDRLLIVGTIDASDLTFGSVTEFDVSGDNVPVIHYPINFRTNSYFNGIRERPGGGYFIFGSGNLCEVEDERDGLLISIKANLVDTVTHCYQETRSIDGREILISSSEAGFASERTDPRFTPPFFTTLPSSSSRLFCPRLSLDPKELADPLCYEEPFLLFESATLISPPGSVDRIIVIIGERGANTADNLLINDPPPGVIVEGNGSRRITLTLEEGRNSGALTEALSRLRFMTDGRAVTGGQRSVGVIPFSACESSPFLRYDFTLAASGPIPFSLPADTALCAGAELLLSGPELPDATYRWSTGATTHTISTDQPGDYTLYVSTACREDSATVRVTEAVDVMELTDETIRESVCLGDSLVFAPEAMAGLTYAWADGAPAGASRVIRAPGTYELRRANACSAATTVLDVSFRDCCRVYLPNAFSPNGDGINDVFRVFPALTDCALLSGFELRVYDRWGGEVYAGTSATAGWDGSVRGEAAPNGTYVYHYRYFNGREEVSGAGNVVLMR